MIRFSVVGMMLFGSFALASSCQPRSGGQAGVQASADSAQIARGHQAYIAYCAMCHGEWGGGDGPLAADLLKQAGATAARLNDRDRLIEVGRDEIIRVIEEGGSHTGRSNLMPPWGDRVAPALIEDIADFILRLPDMNPSPPATLAKFLEAPPGSAEKGRKLYTFYCSICHGPEAKGDGYMADTLWARNQLRPRDLTDGTYLATKSDQELYSTIALGGGHTGKSDYMPAWGFTLAPEQIRHLLSYVRAISGTAAHP